MQGTRILLVEDSPDIQTFVRSIARLEGFQLTVAGTGEQGIDLYANDGPFDLVVLDINLPGIQGWDVLDAIKGSPEPQAKVVIFSAFADAATSEKAAAMGAAGFMAKPIGARELVAHLKAFLEA